MKNIILVFITLFIFSALVSAQEQKIPYNPTLRVGTLDNGLTYYIQHNEYPKDRAEFYIAQKVGSILEEENQRGLAHFLEHMCFNGTENFPGNTMIKELEKKGIKFGENINAYTSIDETVYNLSNIPVTREGIIDTSLLILHDWSGFVSLNAKDIDDERGVIREEWRTTDSGDKRAQEQLIKEVFTGTQYAERMPIGLIEVINNFPYKAIRDYYKKWYRPDLQAIIVVGDIDVDQVEAKIKSVFSDVSAPKNPAFRKTFPIPNNIEPIVSVTSDSEVQSTSVLVFNKRDAYPKEKKDLVSYYKRTLFDNLISSMFNQRMYELTQESNPPFADSYGGMSDFFVAPTKWAWTVEVQPIDNNSAVPALRALLIENERMHQFGFTHSEYERAKINMLRSYENAYQGKGKIDNNEFVKEYVKLFLDNEPAAGIEWEFEAVNSILADTKLSTINELAKSYVGDTNLVVGVMGPKSADVLLPSKKEILSLLNEVRQLKLEPYTDEMSDKPLLDKMPEAGKVVKTEQKPFGYTQWTLSNGLKVMVKKTDFKKDEVLMSAYSSGGISLVKDEDLPSALVMNSLVEIGGLGKLNQIELGKALTGKVVSISLNVSELAEGLSGMASPVDFETLMQLTYLYFTQPRMDEDAFVNWKKSMKNTLENRSLNPMTSLSDTLSSIIRTSDPTNPRGKKFDLDMLDKVDYTKSIELYKERFANAGDFTFFITGNVDLDKVKTQVETYLGGLPSIHSHESYKDNKVYAPKGVVKNHFNRELQTPKSTVVVLYTGKTTATFKNQVLMNYLTSLLTIVYNEKIREQEGGSYGVNVSGIVSKKPRERFGLQISFDTDPTLREKLLAIVYAEIKNMMEQGPSEENVNKVKENKLKSQYEQLLENGYWENVISTLVVDKEDVFTDYEKIVSSVTPEMVQKFAKEIFSQKNIMEVSMSPQ